MSKNLASAGVPKLNEQPQYVRPTAVMQSYGLMEAMSGRFYRVVDETGHAVCCQSSSGWSAATYKTESAAVNFLYRSQRAYDAMMRRQRNA